MSFNPNTSTTVLVNDEKEISYIVVHASSVARRDESSAKFNLDIAYQLYTAGN